MASSQSTKQAAAAVTQELLSRAHSPDSANRIYADKIQHRPLFLKPNSPPPPDPRDLRRKARFEKRSRARAQKPKPLSARQRRTLGLHDLPRDRQKYAVFEPLHALWLGYVRELLAGDLYTGSQAAAGKLSSADFHGALLEVTRSRCPSRVGIRGIVVKDSRFVFEVVTPKDQLKIVPKEGTMFRVEVPAAGADASTPAFVFEIHGDQFQYRSADRTNKKFKSHFLKHV